MEQEYSTSAGYKIFYGLCALAAVIGAAFMFSKAAQTEALALPGILFAFLAIAIGVNLYKRKAIITDTDVTYTSIWGSRTLDKQEIRGYRFDEKRIVIEPVQGGGGKIIIRDYGSLADIKGLRQTLAGYYKDLNAEEYEESKEEVLHDDTFGANANDRAAALAKMKRLTMAFSLGGMILLAVVLFSGYSSPELAYLELAYPLLGLALLFYGKGIVRLYTPKNNARPAVFPGMLFSCGSSVFAGLAKANIIDAHNLFAPMFIVAVAMGGVLYYVAIERPQLAVWQQIFCVLVIAAAYGAGSVSLSNRTFDRSEVKVYPTTIIDKHASHGKSTSYYFTIDKWGNGYGNEDIEVDRSVYNNTNIGSPINVNLKKGFFNAPWFYVSY